VDLQGAILTGEKDAHQIVEQAGVERRAEGDLKGSNRKRRTIFKCERALVRGKSQERNGKGGTTRVESTRRRRRVHLAENNEN